MKIFNRSVKRVTDKIRTHFEMLGRYHTAMNAVTEARRTRDAHLREAVALCEQAIEQPAKHIATQLDHEPILAALRAAVAADYLLREQVATANWAGCQCGRKRLDIWKTGGK